MRQSITLLQLQALQACMFLSVLTRPPRIDMPPETGGAMTMVLPFRQKVIVKRVDKMEDEYLEEDRYAQEVSFFEEREDPKTDKDTEENQAWIKRQKGHKACREELII